MISCLLLSAGLSERFGSPKALAQINQTTAIQKIQNSLLQSVCDEIIIVLGSHAEQIKPYLFNHKRIRIVYNKDYILGQTSSIQVGCRNTNASADKILLLPVDCPFIQTSTIDTVIHQFKVRQPNILIPSYQAKKGHPPIFHVGLKNEILNIPLNQGINSLFIKYPPELIEINDPGITKSFNTPQELTKIKSH